MNFSTATLNNEFLTFINNDLTIDGELFVNKIKTDDITTSNLIVNGITTSNLIVNIIMIFKAQI